jgi:hypothetical protein
MGWDVEWQAHFGRCPASWAKVLPMNQHYRNVGLRLNGAFDRAFFRLLPGLFDDPARDGSHHFARSQASGLHDQPIVRTADGDGATVH